MILSISITLHSGSANDFLLFDVIDNSKNEQLAPLIHSWKTFSLDPDYGGLWLVAGDVDSDGRPEIVSSENFNENDVHYTTTAVAQKLDGAVLWTWGNPDIGRKIWHHDVACQIHDWDNDGRKEVILLTKGFLVELDGATGAEKRRFPIPDDATDCLVFCDLAGKGYPSDILIKNRYHQIWAYNHSGNLLWTVVDPGGYKTAHQPYPVDLDHDGRDEIMAGYAMLNSDGGVRWIYKSKTVDQSRGHLDCARVVRRGPTPEETRLALTCCGAENLAMIDGNGQILWEISGRHFESINVGEFDSSRPGLEILVDIDHLPWGESPLWVLDTMGNRLGRIIADYCRHHKFLDWTGDGLAEIVIAQNQAIYDQQGKRIFTLAIPPGDRQVEQGETSLLTGEMTGDGILDLLIVNPDRVSIFKNENGRKPERPVPLGTGLNVTLY